MILLHFGEPLKKKYFFLVVLFFLTLRNNNLGYERAECYTKKAVAPVTPLLGVQDYRKVNFSCVKIHMNKRSLGHVIYSNIIDTGKIILYTFN